MSAGPKQGAILRGSTNGTLGRYDAESLDARASARAFDAERAEQRDPLVGQIGGVRTAA